MHYSQYLLWSIIPLTCALPAGPGGALQVKREDKPPLPYPPGYSRDTCPDTTNGNNPFAHYFAPHDKKKRDVSSADVVVPDSNEKQPPNLLVARQPAPCRQIAYNDDINAFDPGNGGFNVGNTGQVALVGHATYVLSWGFTVAVRAIRSFHNYGNGYSQFQRQFVPGGANRAEGTFQFTTAQAQNAHFEFEFEDESVFPGDPLAIVFGELAIFQIGPG